jgi:hypothetical protein
VGIVTTYTITFDRIGRTHNPPPYTVDAASIDILETKIMKRVRPLLRSRDVEIILNDDVKGGWIACGMQSGGGFTIETSP